MRRPVHTTRPVTHASSRAKVSARTHDRQRVARGQHVRLLEPDAARDVDVKQVHLAVLGDDVALAIEGDTCVEHLVAGLLGVGT